MQTVLALQVDKFGNAPMNHKMCAPLLGDGIMTVDGHAWKRSRHMLNPVFARAQVSELSSFEVHVGTMINRIPRDGSMVDMQPLCKMLFLDNSTEFIFGKSANSLSPELTGTVARRLVHLFDEALVGMFKRYMLGRFKFLAGEKKWLAKCAEVQGIIDDLIDEEFKAQKAVAENKTAATDTPYNYVLLKELVKTTDDRRFIRNELMNVFFPARDTAGILTSNIIFMLARYPDVWSKLRAEVLGIGDQKLTFELLKSLKYTHAVINESKPPLAPQINFPTNPSPPALRLQTPVGGSWKTCLEPCILPHGGGPSGQDPILLEPGDEVRMSFTPLHTDPGIWGADALDFKPERWARLKQSWNFIPFMGGRRICPAQQNALTDVCYVLVRLAREFRAIENRDETLEYVDKIVFTRESKNGVKVAFVAEE
ncbi:Cytochrome P450 family protein [Rutstroemia sp. NJR-2017a BVV2]|nr:Cytochrome P450 family protein [Rutstroemia sp. NJR-2017a BVV2]